MERENKNWSEGLIGKLTLRGWNKMNIYTKNELEEALLIVSSTITNCEKTQPKFMEGTSQHTLLKNW